MNMSLAAGVKAEVVVTYRIGKCGRTYFKGVLINICCVWGYYVEKRRKISLENIRISCFSLHFAINNEQQCREKES